MISELLSSLMGKVSSKTVTKLVSKGLTKSISEVERNVEKKLNRALQRNLNVAVRKAKKEMFHTGMLMFSILLILISLFMILSKYFPAEYLLLVSGAVLFSITVASK